MSLFDDEPTPAKEKKKRKKRFSKQEWIAEQNAKPFETKDIVEYLIYLLKDRDYTSGKLKQKLRQHERFKRDQTLHQDAIDKVVEWGYVNDQNFLERLVKNLMDQNVGLGKIRDKLYQKGFSSALIEQGVSMTSEKDFFPVAMEAKRKKYGLEPVTDQKIKQRALGFLVRKGFSFQDANKALSMSEEEWEEYLSEQQGEDDPDTWGSH